MNTYKLTVYVAGRTPGTNRMVTALRHRCRREAAGKVALSIVDVLKQPHAADKARVVATPTIVCESKWGVHRVVGDLANLDRLMAGLRIPSHAKPSKPGGNGQARHRENGNGNASAHGNGHANGGGAPNANGHEPLDRPSINPRRLGGAEAACLVERSIDAIVLVDRTGMIRWANPAAEALLGRDHGDLVGSPFGFPVVDGGSMELAILRPDHTTAIADMRAVELDWEGERVHAATLRDITDRKRAESALKASELRFRLMVEGATDHAIVILDERGRVAEWNDGAARMTGYNREDIVGRSIATFHVLEDLTSRKAERLLAGARSKGRVEDEGWRVRQDGSRFWANVVLTALKNSDGQITGFCKVTRDMSERRGWEKRFLELKQRALLTQLAKGVAHRFNNIMCGVTVGMELVLLRMPDDDELRPLMETMRVSAARATKLTTELLVFSGSHANQARLVDLAQLLTRLEGNLRGWLGDAVTFRLTTCQPPFHVNLDPEQFQVLVQNLATNARDAMAKGGLFTIDLSRVTPDEPLLQQHPDLDAVEHVRVLLTDNGTGMSEETRAHLFEPFYTTKQPQCDGLGLAVCREIVRQNSGHMSVTSQPGSGTRVEILFPCAGAGAPPSLPVSAPETAPLEGGSETILLVDDDAQLRGTTAGALRTLGYTVVEAGGCEEAVHLLKSGDIPHIDGVVADGKLPNLGGKVLAGEVYALFPNARMLFLSGHPSAADGVRVVPELGMATLHPPYTLATVARKLREVLD